MTALYKHCSAALAMKSHIQLLKRQSTAETNFSLLFGSFMSLILNACRGMHRYLSDYLNCLPLGVLTRLVRTNDTLMALVPLLEEPPWVRKRNKKTEKFIGNVWAAVEPKERLRLTQHDAQASEKGRKCNWLVLHEGMFRLHLGLPGSISALLSFLTAKQKPRCADKHTACLAS